MPVFFNLKCDRIRTTIWTVRCSCPLLLQPIKLYSGGTDMDRMKLQEADIDYDAGLRHFAGKEILYHRFLKEFPQDEHFLQAKEACEKNDTDGILAGVHALKGIAGTLGMTNLFDDCQELVKYIRSGQTTEISNLFEIITVEYEAVAAVLKNME